MNADLKKWNPFKFLRGAARKSDKDSPESTPASEQWRASWPSPNFDFSSSRNPRQRWVSAFF
jgi:hypothetical protein